LPDVLTSGKNVFPEVRGSGKRFFLHTCAVLTYGNVGGNFSWCFDFRQKSVSWCCDIRKNL